MLNIADFDEAFNKPTNVEQIPCQPPACFVGSYAPVSQVKKVASSTTPTFSRRIVSLKPLVLSRCEVVILKSASSKLKIKHVTN